MIFGIGTDIVAIKRIEEALFKHGDRFLHRILSEEEVAEYAKTHKPARFLAKRFAVKEAFSKAFGTGIGESVNWHDVRVTHDGMGKPSLAVTAPLQARLDAVNVTQTQVSISDEQDYAIAFVVLEKS